MAVRAQRTDAEAALKQVISLDLLDKGRKLVAKESFVEIPVKRPHPDLQVVLQKEPAFYRSTPDLVSALKGEMKSDQLHLLPRGWYILGDVIVVKIHPSLGQYQNRIAQVLLSIYPRCKAVLRDFGIEGQLREPVREVIAGEGTETVHRENGILFRLDAKKIMFSPGNLRERMRMSRLGNGEFVVDMFAGIGYFSLPMAVHSRPSRVTAIELNPVAYDYLCQNIRLNHVEEIVQPVLGDCAKETPEGVADRVVMGLVQVTDRYLGTGIEALRPGGILHYHQTVPSWQYPQAAVKDVMKAAQLAGCRATIESCIRVKKYSPGVVHAVVDARIDKD
jgi:tRNA wybutosine-synthesizing protein 2